MIEESKPYVKQFYSKLRCIDPRNLFIYGDFNTI